MSMLAGLRCALTAHLGACVEVQELQAIQHAGVCQLADHPHDLGAPQPELRQIAYTRRQSTE